jgi:hypothetical protein
MLMGLVPYGQLRSQDEKCGSLDLIPRWRKWQIERKFKKRKVH